VPDVIGKLSKTFFCLLTQLLNEIANDLMCVVSINRILVEDVRYIGLSG